MAYLRISRSTGALMSITADNVALHVSQSWGYYTSFDATMDQSGDNTARAQQVRTLRVDFLSFH